MRRSAFLLLVGVVFSCWMRMYAEVRGHVEEENITVLLFHTEEVQRVQVRAKRVALRRCSGCAAEVGPVALDVHVRDGRMLDAQDHVIPSVAWSGEAEVVTGGNRRATAAGEWRIEAEHARLRVWLTVSRERYVAAVLAAEAGAGAPAEALKAMAVTVRSFAAAAPRRHANGEFCDSTHCQALRFEAVPQTLRDAVWSTSSETLWFGGKRVPAYFSQHCGGVTEDAAEAWGGRPMPWLPSHVDAWCARTPGQWHASLPEAEVRTALLREGFPTAGPILEIAAVRRDRSGRVQQVRLKAGDTTRVLPAATLRFALDRSLGWYQLRSDRYQVRRVGDRIVFEGTGFGHGVGLCQAGAEAMARAGKGYREILATYFPGTRVRVRAQDAGWVQRQANGFVLRSTREDTALEHDATRAFADARARWAAPVKAPLELTIFPSTEAFRQATGQPGWELATTAGSRIAAQPPEVLRTHGGEVFRHEFLHGFVEGEAAASAPLWLREGLVEVLNGEPCASQTDVPAATVDAALRGAESLAQSQRAHAAACSLTKHLTAERGLVGVHALLQGR